ncbi:putative flavoprotein monooxygenase [Klebsiella pneumoniae subsp. pneumoniae DSM 30104 = JCM 1662 = NBRC 14940]|nr:putative flavoprotein monooxygenase [Klebsiella pneumoniae subsp. pneumoniae DSM 30104 = JCM 1662 = NBRC 14940]
MQKLLIHKKATNTSHCTDAVRHEPSLCLRQAVFLPPANWYANCCSQSQHREKEKK